MRKSNQRPFPIDIRNFTKIKKLDNGGFGEVFLAQYQKTGESFAAKVLKRDVNNPQTRKLIDNEIDIMRSIDHPTIIKYLGYSLVDFRQEKNVTIIMELARNRSLDDAIEKCRKNNRPKGYDNTARQIILIGIASAMKYLHQHCIIHRDLKPNNVLLNDNLYPLLIDFGTAKFFDKKHTNDQSQHCGTLSYMAPEVINSTRYNWKVDVYSFAILMYEVVTELDPYPRLEKTDTAIKDLKRRIANYNLRPEFKGQINNSLKKLIEKCWSPDPTDRPNFDEIFENLITTEYFLDDVDINKINHYVEYITKDEKIEEQKKKTNSSSNLNSNLNSKEYDLIKSANNQLKSDNEFLKEQISNLRRENQQLTTKIEALTKKLEAYEKAESNSFQLIVKPPSPRENRNEEPTPRSPRDRKDENTVARTPPRFPPRERRDESFVSRTPQRLAISARTERRDEKQIIRPISFTPRKEVDNYSKSMRRISPSKEDEAMTRSQKSREADSFSKSMRNISPSKEDEAMTRSQKSREADSFSKSMRNISPSKEDEAMLRSQKSREADSFSKSMRNISPSKEDEANSRSPKPSDGKENDSILKTMTKISPSKDDGVIVRPSIIWDRKEIDNFSKSMAKIPIQKEKPDEEILAKLPPLRKAKSDDVSPKSITVAEFNSYPIQLQQSFLSRIIMNVMRKKINNFLSNVNNLLLFILQFLSSPEATNYIEIQSDDPEESLDNIKYVDDVNILANATETLYYNKSLDSAEFIDLISEFNNVSFELKYLSKSYMGSYRIISDMMCNEIQINIFISGLKKTDNTFKGNQKINSIKIDSSVTSIGDYAFKGCSSLTQVSIPSSVTSIGSGSFEGCSSLKQISIPSSVVSIGFSICKGCSSLTEVSLVYSLKLIRSNAFNGCSSLKQITIPSSVTSIGEYAFYGCSSMTEVVVPSSVTSIGEFAFSRCSSLTEINIPSSVASMGKCVFEGCSSLKQISIPESINNAQLLGIPSEAIVSSS